MFTINGFFMSKLLLSLNFYFIFFSCIISAIIYYGSKIFNMQNFFRNFSSMALIKYFLLASLLVSFFIHMLVIYFYCSFYYNYLNLVFYDDNLIVPTLTEFNNFSFIKFIQTLNINLYLSIDLFGLILLLLAYIVGFISILTLDTRLY